MPQPSPDIRISTFMPAAGHSFVNVGAVGFGPPGIGDNPLSGDILFNLAATHDIVAGMEDMTALPPVTNDLEGLFLHELGHAAIGLGHPPWDGEGPDQRVMYVGDFGNPSAPLCCQTINRQLHADDIAGAQSVYGPLPLLGDANSDGHINGLDVAPFVDVVIFGAGDLTLESKTDMNRDGAVNGLDVQLFVQAVIGGQTVVPEPETVNLAGMALISLVALGWRRRAV